MPQTNEWSGDWDEIATDHVHANFRSMVAHIYYRHASSLDELLHIIHATHPEVTRSQLIAKFKSEDLPLRKSDERR